jgi:aryl-alcohol dehydrogenase-like predicted oxidoreductase
MQQRAFGTTGYRISTIGLGTWAIGGWMWGEQDDAASEAAIHAAVDHGVNWIDTAPIYGGGHSETMVGRALKKLSVAQRPLIFTKFGLGADVAVNRRAAGRADVLAECEASLRRLDVEAIDLYQLHWPSPEPLEETARACEELLRAGKIRAIGVSNFTVDQLEAWRGTGVPLHTLQSPFSILRPAAKATVIPWCAAHDVGVIAYSPLFRGLLFGTWTKDKTFAPDDTRGAHKDYSGPRFARHIDAVQEITALAIQNGLSCPQLCVGVLLRTPGLTGCIVGARNARQGALIASLGVAVTDELADAVWGIVKRLEADLAQL